MVNKKPESNGSDFRSVDCYTVDLRDIDVDETKHHKPGHPFRCMLFKSDGQYPIAEIKLRRGSVDVSLVAELTGRPGVIEITPDHARAAVTDRKYRLSLLTWIDRGLS